MLLIRHSYIKLVHLSCVTIIPFAFLRPLIAPDHCVCKLVLTLDFKFSQVDMVISLDDVDIIVMPRMNIGELTETCRLSAWYRPLFHFAYTFAHILPNATLAFAVLVINTHCCGETASRVDGCIKQISICPLCLVWVRAPRWQHT